MNLISQKNRFGSKSNLLSYIFLTVLLTALTLMMSLNANLAKENSNPLPKIDPSIMTYNPASHIDTNYQIPVFDPFKFTQSSEIDSDSDGLSDRDEIKYGTNPYLRDSDFDKLIDGAEVYIFKTIPNLPDSDRDYIIDSLEIFCFHTNPMDSDMDNDGLVDGLAVYRFKTNPYLPDTDYDLLNDFDEIRIFRTDVLHHDSDQDGIQDGLEVHVYQTNPLSNDTDNDHLSDFWEITNGHNPLKKDNWSYFAGVYIAPGFSVIVILISLFASLDTKLIQPLEFKYPIQKPHNLKITQTHLLQLLAKVPNNQTLNIEELSNLTGESVKTINRLLSSVFNDKNTNEEHFKLDEVTIHSHTGKTYFEYRCFYCSNPIDYTLAYCPFCDEDIVRCRECKKPINNDDYYATLAIYETFGEPNNVTGFIEIELICESCLLKKRYNLI
ncbi:MAG: hypothetical protein FK734_02390 [Asgard group archaeon]|nr:hypothetical protein [Asgard group archaeon]